MRPRAGNLPVRRSARPHLRIHRQPSNQSQAAPLPSVCSITGQKETSTGGSLPCYSQSCLINNHGCGWYSAPLNPEGMRMPTECSQCPRPEDGGFERFRFLITEFDVKLARELVAKKKRDALLIEYD